MAVVADVTGSTYPYTGQLLLWLKMQSVDSFTTNYTFFNDGDNLPDNKKKIGKTGGVYSQQCKSFQEVLGIVKSTMLKGGGGDSPENNIEALIASEEQYPESDFSVLIADNWASVKDIKIISRLKKPVRIVLCGVKENLINPVYLDLARQTGGSLHLIDEDLYRLALMHEGETIQIGACTFKIVDGSFRDISFNKEVVL